MKIEYLQWDSNFFGLKIGKLDLSSSVSFCDVEKEIQIGKKEEYDLLYLFYSDHETDFSFQNFLGQKGNLVDEKVTYEKKLNKETAYLKDSDNITNYIGRSLTSDLQELALLSGQYSRFLLDKNFPKKSFEKLYTEWIYKSLMGEIADKVYVYEKNNMPIGFVTLKIEKKTKHSQIGLIAVSSREQGLGVGKKLITKCVNYSNKVGCDKIVVPTQQANKGACQFYERNKFLVKNTTNIYHLWL